MIFKVVKHLILLVAIKTVSKPNCNLCMEERISILKKLRDKHVMVMYNNLKIYGACWQKTTFGQFCLITDDFIEWGKWLGRKTSFQTLASKLSMVVLVLEFFYRSSKIEKLIIYQNKIALFASYELMIIF